jgi:hypothetical protein
MLGNTFVSVLQLGGPKRCFHWGVLNVPKKFADKPMNVALSKKKERYECTNELNNMDHTIQVGKMD